jgi:hypothetical protein
MDIRRGESALQQLEKGSVSLNELLQDMQAVSQKFLTLDQIQRELVETDNRLKGIIRHFDDRLLEALSPILQELSLRQKDTSDNLAGLKFELSTQLTSIGNRIDGLERQQLTTHGLQNWILILLAVTCAGSLGVLYSVVRPLIH